jgi:tRNA-dihydrouridine synthase
MTAPAFYVRHLPIYGDLILSPMDGYSDQPYRSMCRSLGSAMSYTEFINALDVLQGHPHLWRKLAYLEQERPVVYQIFDNEPACRGAAPERACCASQRRSPVSSACLAAHCRFL